MKILLFLISLVTALNARDLKYSDPLNIISVDSGHSTTSVVHATSGDVAFKKDASFEGTGTFTMGLDVTNDTGLKLYNTNDANGVLISHATNPGPEYTRRFPPNQCADGEIEVYRTAAQGHVCEAQSGGGGGAEGREGCNPSRLSLTQIRIGPCALVVNGTAVATATGTDITLEPALQSATAVFYIYAEDGSSGSTLNATTVSEAPDSNGLRPGTNDKIIGRGYNRGESIWGIDEYSLDRHDGGAFIARETGWIDGGGVSFDATTTAPTKPSSPETDTFKWKRKGSNMIVQQKLFSSSATGGANGSGDYLILLTGEHFIDSSNTTFYATTEGTGGYIMQGSHVGVGEFSWGGIRFANTFIVPYSSTSVRAFVRAYTDNTGGFQNMGAYGSGFGVFVSANQSFSADFSVPILGWGD